MSDASLQQNRDRWIDEVCSDVLQALGGVGVDLKGTVRRDLGRGQLTAALLTAWIANCLAGGDARWRIAEQVFASRVLAPEASSEERILRLIDQVEALLFARGLPIGEPWDPRTGFTFLLETWAAERRQTVDDDTLVSQLRRHWDTTDSYAIRYLLQLEPKPMAEHLTLTQRVEADGRELVQAIVAQAFTDDLIQSQREAIMDAMHVLDVEHLRALAVDVTTVTLVGDRIRQFGEFAHSAAKHELAIAAAAAQFLIEDARHATSDTLGNLSAYEVSRLFLDPDHHFQTACLDAFTARDRSTRRGDRLTSERGSFGPLPWWRVVVDDDNRQHIAAILDQRASGIGLRWDDGSTIVSLHLYDPEGEYFLTFAYRLESIADAFELMLLGRTERLGIDFEEEANGKRVRVGTYSAPLPDEICGSLRSAATAALREHLGFDPGYADYSAVRSAAEAALFSRSVREIWSRPSSLFGSAVDASGGGGG